MLLIDGDTVAVSQVPALKERLGRTAEMVACQFYSSNFLLKRDATALRSLDVTPISASTREGREKAMVQDVLGHALQACQERTTKAGASFEEPLRIIVATKDLTLGLNSLRQLKGHQAAQGYLATFTLPHMAAAGHVVRGVQSVGAHLLVVPTPARRSAISVTMDGATSIISVEEETPPRKLFDEVQLQSAASRLNHLGYLSAGGAARGYPTGKAMAKFYFVNKLGPVVIYPLDNGLAQLLNLFARHSEADWLPDPGDLAYIVPKGGRGTTTVCGTDRAARHAAAGGPFILRKSERLLQETLKVMGYFDDAEPHHYFAAVELFYALNIKALRTCGLHLDSHDVSSFTSKEQTINAALAGDSELEVEWRIPLSDRSLREFLHHKGLLSDANAPQTEVLATACHFLQKVGWIICAPEYYHEVVTLGVQYMNRLDPMLDRGAAPRFGSQRG